MDPIHFNQSYKNKNYVHANVTEQKKYLQFIEKDCGAMRN